jgi:hypothetical protein
MRFDALFEGLTAGRSVCLLKIKHWERVVYILQYCGTLCGKKQSMANEAIEPLILDLLEWVSKGDRSYEEVMAAWRTSCPRLPVWEEANDRRLVMADEKKGRHIVRITPSGRALLRRRT